eukprot:CAMPEP_0116878914 /NCGR_PEP_ID=MMETSP0463-20121206/10664_1 /TAXON_ID=181622 /ORGANISM="Strombidinopsis sp, Strain SopsisLIS2011" /LENGTH=203 /DNA_ID=CAMNT_0004527611 /DNA_START=1087 /DNA_END=1698 /DNA_ORIENTATION=-
MIYYELEKRTQKQMGKVLLFGSSGAVILYLVIGVCGYATFVNYPEYTANEALKSGNILEAPYENVKAITIGNFALFFAISSAAPLVVLPAKDTVEEIICRGNQMTNNQNVLVTFVLIFTCYCMGLFIPNISAAMTLVGATTNPAVGFILPIVFYWATIPEKSIFSVQKLTALAVATIIIMVSILGLINFFMENSSSSSESSLE